LYKILRELKEGGLVSEHMRDGKILFTPLPPDALLVNAEQKSKGAREAVLRTEQAVAKLRSKYLVSFQRPSIQYYAGVEELKRMYDASLKTKGGKAFLVRANDALTHPHHFGKWWAHFLNRRSKNGTTYHALTTDHKAALHDPKIDSAKKIIRTWLRPEDYMAPIDIHVNGGVVSIVSYGKEIFGLTIENAEIAKAFMDLFALAEKGAQGIEVTHQHG
jgi:hypothetical protein